MYTGDGFSIDTDLMTIMNSQEITSEADLQTALTQIEGRYNTHLETQVVDTIKAAYASHRRISGIWLHLKNWTGGLAEATGTGADQIRLAYEQIPDPNIAASTYNPANNGDTTMRSSHDPVNTFGDAMGQSLGALTQGAQQIPQMATQIPQASPGFGESMQQAFQPVQELIQEIAHALENKAPDGETDSMNDYDEGQIHHPRQHNEDFDSEISSREEEIEPAGSENNHYDSETHKPELEQITTDSDSAIYPDLAETQLNSAAAMTDQSANDFIIRDSISLP